jgi:hypothetical protein
MTPEKIRLEEADRGVRPWKRWGPYVSDRQWGTVREDYSHDAEAWDYVSHDAARSRAYRWGEDGIGGVCDERQLLCLAPAFWNGRDPILKERLFGLTGREGNHGEDVKEFYGYLDSTPTHSYMRMVYKYPQEEFPYRRLVEENRRRNRHEREFELIDTGVFDRDRYFDIFVEYAKADPEDILLRITALNRGAEPAEIHLIPHLWFRNTWSWETAAPRPSLDREANHLSASHPELGTMLLYAEGEPEILFCENETNTARLFSFSGSPGPRKDGIHDYVVRGRTEAVRTRGPATKAALRYEARLAAGETFVVRLRLRRGALDEPFAGFEECFQTRRREADDFYAELRDPAESDDARAVRRQALAGMLWSKQFYHFDVARWMEGDPAQPTPPPERRSGRNWGWEHLNTADIISMPDKWEFPWFAAWDLAFHCIPLALVDPEFAKQQLVLLTREWYTHPNGQLPAYEWAFGDVNPPVHAWAAWRVYKIDRKQAGRPDHAFLERVFHKMLLNFTWWVNRKDQDNRNIFQGGFLGLDNIGVFDRSASLPTGGHLDQADGTSWMAMFALNMMRIALELAERNPVYQDLATKFFEHFLYIADAMIHIGGGDLSLWDEEDRFFYDVLRFPDGSRVPLRVRSMVGLTPLFAVEILEPALLDRVPEFKERLEWFLTYRPDLARLVSRWYEPGVGKRRLLSLLRGHRMKCLLRRMLDENEFLSDYGIRSMSKHHERHPYRFHHAGCTLVADYQPAESNTDLFGGNSNWRGPVWFPLNFLIVESLRRFHHYYGDDFKVECPTGSGQYTTLEGVADELASRLVRIFLRDERGSRPVFGAHPKLRSDPHFRDIIPFHEYFHGDHGEGLGAAHQTGWTGLAAKLLQPAADRARDNQG